MAQDLRDDERLVFEAPVDVPSLAQLVGVLTDTAIQGLAQGLRDR
jgi:hypothetical protein